MAHISRKPVPIDASKTNMQDLDRLLQRLELTLLSEDANSSKLRHSQYDRRKIGANVEYARTLLLRLEHDTSTIKVQSRRQSLNADLQAKRELIKRLNRRLIELDQLDSSDDDSSEDDEDDTAAPTVREFAPAQSTSSGLDREEPPPEPGTAPETILRDALLRSRNPNFQPPASTDTATTTSALFSGSKSQQEAKDASSSLHQTETLLSHNRTEQETLSASLVALAQSLKQSSVNFASSLESEKSVLARAEGGLDKNALGMEAAERRMGTLRRMTEGQGWLGRLKLYGIIAALWVAAFLLVFVGPKLRF